MSQNNYDKYDEIICNRIFNLILAVKTYYRFRIYDLYIKKDAGIITKTEYGQELSQGKYFEDVKKYYKSLCTDKIKQVGLTTNNYSFEKVYTFDDEIIEKMMNIEIKELAPYFIDRIISQKEYDKIKENLRQEEELDEPEQ